MAAVLPVELCHQGLVGVPDHQDAGVERLDLLPAALVRLNADGPAAAPVVALPFKPWEPVTPAFLHAVARNSPKSQRSKRTFIVERAVEVVAAGVEAGGQLDQVASPGVSGSGEAGQRHQTLGSGGQEVAVHAALVWRESHGFTSELLFLTITDRHRRCLKDTELRRRQDRRKVTKGQTWEMRRCDMAWLPERSPPPRPDVNAAAKRKRDVKRGCVGVFSSELRKRPSSHTAPAPLLICEK